jgi:NADH:ubiquinone oxidoreductase subunit 6 (subunit J)
MVVVYRGATIVLFWLTFMMVSHNTQILKYLDEKPVSQQTQAKPHGSIAQKDQIKEVPK